MLGRKLYRKAERFPAEVECEISYEDKQINCITSDVSEGGLAIMLNTPKYIPYNKSINVKLVTDRYCSNFEAQIVHVVQIKDKWKYALAVKQIDDINLKELLGITYDRIPSLPIYIKINIRVLEKMAYIIKYLV
jgi:cellulose synthase (UDP-forming)